MHFAVQAAQNSLVRYIFRGRRRFSMSTLSVIEMISVSTVTSRGMAFLYGILTHA
jgi:hypothetical protein